MERSAATFAQWVAEARGTLGLEVRGIVPLAPTTWLFLLGSPGETNLRARWLLAREPTRARFHVVPPRRDRTARDPHSDRDEPRATDSALLLISRKLLLGQRVSAIEQPFRDRTIRIAFEADGRVRHALIAELYGAAPRFVLVDAEERILQVEPLPKTGDRLHRGKRYAPPAGSKPEPPAENAAFAPPSTNALDAESKEFAERHPWSFAAHLYFGDRDREQRERERLAQWVRRTRDALEHARSRVAALESESAGATVAIDLRQRADVLAAHLHEVKRGALSIEVDDLYAERRIEIVLDPSIAPHENLRRMYHAADKKDRGAAYARSELDAAVTRVRDLAELARSLEEHESAGALPQILIERALALGLLKREPAPPNPPRESKHHDPDRSEIRRFRLRSGIEALVGGSDRANDHLTHRMARGNDWWLHVQSYEGAHVVLRVPAGKTPSLDDLLDAGRLAIHFSKRRGHDGIVMYTQKKHVRKGRGQPGAALVDRHQELRIRHDESATRTLLGSDRGGE